MKNEKQYEKKHERSEAAYDASERETGYEYYRNKECGENEPGIDICPQDKNTQDKDRQYLNPWVQSVYDRVSGNILTPLMHVALPQEWLYFQCVVW